MSGQEVMNKPKLDLIFSKTNPRDKYARAAIQLKVHDLLLNKYDINVIKPRDIIKAPINNGADSIDSVQVMTIVNPLNKKAIVFNVGPKCSGPILSSNKGWTDFNVVQVIGGASVSKDWYESLNSERKNFFDCSRSPICFPLDQTTHEEFILKFNPDKSFKKTRQAFFLGNTQNLIGRIKISEILNKHPLFKIVDRKGCGRKFEDYIKEMSQYKITLSLNGFAEACYRDWESMGIGVPIVRSEFYSQYDSKIIPDFHYISGSEHTINGETVYKSSFKDVADKLISTVESHIDNEDFLNEVSENGKKYFIENLTCDAIIRKFMKLVKLELLFNE